MSATASGRCRMICNETNCTRYDGDHHLSRHHRFSDAEPRKAYVADAYVADWFLHNFANGGLARSSVAALYRRRSSGSICLRSGSAHSFQSSDPYTDLTFGLASYAPRPNPSNGIANPKTRVCSSGSSPWMTSSDRPE